MVRNTEIKPAKDFVFLACPKPSSYSHSHSSGELVTLVIDSITLDMIDQSTIDYKEEMIRSSFEIIANPNAELGCSCGTSFSPKKPAS
mmetsp:Transcript_987/g.1770  ORF Transcript_987/g.1770 Transcript_987/m.1770 type:complete len:88 (+) Transcript_987:645-908(+)